MIVARLRAWLKALYHWLAEAHLVWVTLLVIGLALSICLRRGTTDLQIRLTALGLQWLGIGTVAHGVHETRKLFGRPGILHLLRQWLSRFPRWHRRVIVATGTGSLGLSGGVARAHVWSNVDPAAPIEVQLNALKQNVERLNERLIQTQNEMDREIHKHSEALRQEEQTRAKGDQDLQLRLETAETGGLHITFIGVVWLFLGVLLGSLSPELARWRS